MRKRGAGPAARALVLMALGRGSALAAELSLPGTNVLDAVVGPPQTIWAACAGTGLAEGRAGAWRTWAPPVLARRAAEPQRLALLDGALYAACLDAGGWALSGTAWRGVLPPAPVAPEVRDVAAWRGHLWLAAGERLARLTPATGDVAFLEPPLPPGSGSRLTCLAACGDEQLAVGTNRHHLLLFDGSSWEALDFKGRIRGKHVRAVACRGPSLWFCTFGGLYGYREPVLSQLELPPGAPPAPLTSLALEGETLWVGTWGRGLFGFGPKGWRRPAGLPEDLAVNAVRVDGTSLYCCSTRGLWIVGGADGATVPSSGVDVRAADRRPR